MSNDTKLRTAITAILTVSARRLHALTEMAKNLAGPDGEAWHIALKAQLKAGTAEVVSAQLPAKTLATNTQQTAWQRIYDKYFAALEVTVPAFPDTPGKVGIYVAQGLTCDMIYAAWTFKKWKWVDGSIDAQLDQAHEARSSMDAYLVRVENGIEPDQKYLGRSTKSVDADGKIGITLRERMLLELMHYEQTGKHLDVRGVTFCSGSRYRVGHVPGVYLNGIGHVSVYRYPVGTTNEGYGVREAVLEAL